MSKSVAPNQTNVFVKIRMITDADGTPALSVSASTSAHELWYWRDGATAVVTDGGAADNLSSAGAPHADWGMIHITDGYYWCAYPDAAFASGVDSVLCGMDADGYSCIASNITIDPLVKYNGQATAATATTTTLGAANAYKGDILYVTSGTGHGQTRVVTTASGSAGGPILNHNAWDVNISTSNSTLALFPGDSTLADGGINADVAISSRSSHTQADVRTEIDAAVAAGVNTTQIAGVTIIGSGSADSLFRTAGT